VLREIHKERGEASLCEARLVEGLTDNEVRGLFLRAREEDYRSIATDIRKFAHDTFSSRARALSEEARSATATAVIRFRKRLAEIAQIDFFGAPGREAAEGLIAGLEQRISPATPPSTAVSASSLTIAEAQKRVWVTRKGIHIDRIACAWLIRRFIDEDPTFKFVPARGYTPAPRELRFDMFDAEFTHEGDRCSFEVLLERAGLDDPALAAIAEIVHDIDLKDGKFAREEAGGIKMLISGICADTRDDDERLARGMTIFDDLHAVFRRMRGGARTQKR
jgi:hypothetical protein